MASGGNQSGIGIGLENPSGGEGGQPAFPGGGGEPPTSGGGTNALVGGGGGQPAAMPNPADPWWCLDNPGPGYKAPDPAPANVLYIVPIVDSLKQDVRNPPPGLQINLCLPLDPECDEPLPTLAKQVDGQPAGVFQIPVSFGFRGYARFTAPGYLITDYFFGGPMIGMPGGAEVNGVPIVRGLEIMPPKPESVDTWINDLKFTREVGKGILAARAIDCNGQRAANVRIVSDAPGLPFAYNFSEGLFWIEDPTQERTTGPTDKYGLAGFANLTPGIIQFHAELNPSARAYGATPFRIRADQVTVGELRPDGYTYGR